MKAISRRQVIGLTGILLEILGKASLSAIPATALSGLPAAAAGASGDDLVFAAIGRHCKLEQAWRRACPTMRPTRSAAARLVRAQDGLLAWLKTELNHARAWPPSMMTNARPCLRAPDNFGEQLAASEQLSAMIAAAQREITQGAPPAGECNKVG